MLIKTVAALPCQLECSAFAEASTWRVSSMRVSINSRATLSQQRHRVCGGLTDVIAEASMKETMIRLRYAAIVASLALPASANAQTVGDQLSRLFTRTEAKHRSSRRNLTELLRSQPRFWVELHAVAERLQTQPAWLRNVMANESLFNPAAHNPLRDKRRAACCNSSSPPRAGWERPPKRSGE
jgi:hypothetical protein